jgi:nitrogen-specific signal transduction histidine kinase/DNA-binding NarL/FixJ family response regulator
MDGVLIVDDDNDYREILIRELRQKYAYPVVAGAASGEEALALLSSQREKFRFAVIDHQLDKDGMDGIDTTQALVSACPGLYPVVFTNVKADARLSEYKFKALEAGAYRYLEKKGDGPRQISEFVREMEQLEHLRNWIAEFYEARTATPSLLTQLDVGMNVIDRHYKVWFTNEAFRRIIGFAGPGLPQAPCSRYHGYTVFPCDRCLVDKSFQSNAQCSGISLVPLINRVDGKLFFLKVWTQLVTAPTSIANHSNGSVPLAVMESIIDLTGTAELKAIPLDERLCMIERSIWSIRERNYSHKRLFEYVRIYVVNRTGTEAFILKAAASNDFPSQIGNQIGLRKSDGTRLATAEGHMQSSGYGYWFENVDGFDPVIPGNPRIPFIYWPILQDGVTIAVIEVGGHLIRQNTAEILVSYAEEVMRAIMDDCTRTPTASANADAAKSVCEVDQVLQTRPRSAEEQLMEIVSSACKLTDSHQYVFRYRDGDNATLLRLGVPGYCEYENHALPSYPLSRIESWTCRTIMAGTETLINTAEHQNSIMTFREKLGEQARRALQDANSLCYEPLILEGYCIGAMGFHARNVENYDAKKRAILRLLAKRAAWALQDYQMGRAIRERTEADTVAEVLGVVLHNIKTPLASIQIAFDRLIKTCGATVSDSAHTQDLIKTIKSELAKIGYLQQAVVKLRKPWSARIEAVQLHDLIRRVVTGRLEGNDIEPMYSMEPALAEVQIDTAAIEVCLEVLVENAVEAIKDNKSKSLQITLRYAEFAGDGTPIFGKLAIDVVDNGGGVKPEMAVRLFTAMQSGKVSGAGIGLILCRGIARSSYGDVLYDHKYLSGAKFTLLLPYKKEGA